MLVAIRGRFLQHTSNRLTNRPANVPRLFTRPIAVMLFLFTLILPIFSSGQAYSATIVVDKMDDAASGGGPNFCTLRDAIDSINTGANQAGCVGTGNAYGTLDVITIPTGTYTLGAAGQLSITKSVIINGAGSASTFVDGNAASTVFSFSAGTNALSGVKVQNGSNASTGGGIDNITNSNLTIINSVISTNTAGWGGGIYTDPSASLTLTNSTVSGNTAAGGRGAGIRADGVINMTSSAIKDNIGGGGGLSLESTANATLASTAITNNAGGDCVITSGATFTDNGGNSDSDGTCGFSTAPTVTTDAAGNIGQTGATLNGMVTANNASTTATFDYGLDTIYTLGPVTADQSPVTGGPTAVSNTLTGLTCGTLYHYQAKGVNSAGTTTGTDQTFTTTACPAGAGMTYTLDVTVEGGGTGSINGGGINCPGTCSATFTAGTMVTLNGSPGSGNSLAWWTGACTDQWRGDPCEITINTDTSAGAYFESDGGGSSGGSGGSSSGGTTGGTGDGGAPSGTPSGSDAPFLTEPANGGTTGTEVTFMYGSGNSSGSTLELFVCENEDFSGCESPSATTRAGSLAALGGMAGLMMFGFAFIGRRRIPYMLVVIALGGGLLLSACGSSSSSSGDTAGTAGTANGAAETTLSLNPGTTYYWKVTSTDSAGNVTTSDTWSFTTGQ